MRTNLALHYFYFFAFLITELGIYLNPTFGPSLFRTTVMVVVFLFRCLNGAGFLLGSSEPLFIKEVFLHVDP